MQRVVGWMQRAMRQMDVNEFERGVQERVAFPQFICPPRNNVSQ